MIIFGKPPIKRETPLPGRYSPTVAIHTYSDRSRYPSEAPKKTGWPGRSDAGYSSQHSGDRKEQSAHARLSKPTFNI